MNERSSVAQLAESLRRELRHYPDGRMLPSSRALMGQHRVSPGTVSRAIAVLAAEGLVVSRPGAGVFRVRPHGSATGEAGDLSWQQVALSAATGAAPGPRALDASGVLATLTVPPADVIDLAGGYLHPSLQPERALGAALARAGRRPGTWSRPPVEGLPELRAWFAADISGPAHTLGPADVLVTAGGQSALSTALRALAPPGAPVLVESPTYPGLLAIARAAGLRPVPVPVDADGVRTDLLADAFAATGARLFVCQPLFQNPTGAVLAPQRRIEVLRIARAAGAFVVEDDFARQLVHSDAPPLPLPLAAADPDGVVVHVRSLTKVSSPSLRIAAVSARGPALERLRTLQAVDSFFVPRPLQETALELVAAPAWRTHLRQVADALRERRQSLAAGLGEQLLPRPLPYGGYHLWLRLPDGADETALTAAALRAGVAVTPGQAYFPAEPPSPHLRVSYACAAGPQQLVDGGRLLSQVLRAPAARAGSD
ncbi:aminotransferase-like domain-containing protein [Streptacidiphilus cavernicola]|uniref:PLP-dependent aminotransferase family protein n=1 Tax=Streptacidiphilus cavernicola TaxID=3342716 RepID=A0ABV6W4D9_9ACTN